MKSLQRIADGGMDSVITSLEAAQERQSKEGLRAKQLRRIAGGFKEGNLTGLTALAKGIADGIADTNEAKDQDRKDALQARIDELNAWRANNAEHRAEIDNAILASTYMQTQQPVFAQGLQLLDATGDGSALDTALRGSENWMALIRSKLNGADFIGTSARTLPDGTKVIVANGKTPAGEVIGVDVLPMDQGLMNLAPDYVAKQAEEKRAADLNNARIGQANASADASRALAEERRTLDPASPSGGPSANAVASAPAGAAPKLTEEQGKNTAFGTRMAGAMKNIDALEAKFNPANVKDAALSVIPVAGNYLKSDEAQLYDQAKKEFLAGILRGDTGAAITDQEFEMYGPMYFPVVGDRAATMQAKKDARERALQGTLFRAGKGASLVPGVGVSATVGATTNAPADPLEGKTATNPATGQKVIRKGGQWVPMQ